jgi:hypothetical protein
MRTILPQVVNDSRAPEAGVDPIAEFYTRHPYPPPVENLDRARDEWRDPNRVRRVPPVLAPETVPG